MAISFFITGLVLLLYSHDALSAEKQKVYSICQGQSIILDVPGLSRIAVGNEQIADVRVLNETEVLLHGINPGQTSLIIWKDEARESYLVEVMAKPVLDLQEQRSLCNKIHASISELGVNVRFVEDTVVLDGLVKSQEDLDRACAIASLYFDKVKSFLKVHTTKERVSLHVQIIEVSQDSSSKLGISSIDDVVKKGIVKNAEAFLEHLSLVMNEGNAKVLSQPSLVVFEGEKAELLVGGEVPIPVFQGDSISVEWKKYGVSLHITVDVEADGGIIVDLETEVSSLDWNNGIEIGGNSVPAFRVRRETTRVKTYQDNILVLGGLVQTDELEQVEGLPFVSNIPFIGEFFKHRMSTEKQTELIITVMAEVI